MIPNTLQPYPGSGILTGRHRGLGPGFATNCTAGKRDGPGLAGAGFTKTEFGGQHLVAQRRKEFNKDISSPETAASS